MAGDGGGQEGAAERDIGVLALGGGVGDLRLRRRDLGAGGVDLGGGGLGLVGGGVALGGGVLRRRLGLVDLLLGDGGGQGAFQGLISGRGRGRR
jgi:hypothetical protein